MKLVEGFLAYANKIMNLFTTTKPIITGSYLEKRERYARYSDNEWNDEDQPFPFPWRTFLLLFAIVGLITAFVIGHLPGAGK